MTAILNTNMASLYAQKNLATVQTNLAASVQRLSSGLRVNFAKDDAAALGLGASVMARYNVISQVIYGLQNATSLVQTAEGALDAVSKILQRALTLVQQKADQSLSDAQKTSIDTEVAGLVDQITQIRSRTKFNNQSVFDRSFSFANGTNISTLIQIADLNSSSLGLSALSSDNPSDFPNLVPIDILGNYGLQGIGDPLSELEDAPVIETGYIRFTLNGEGDGAIGVGGNTPGLQFDPTGTGNYGEEDYIAPGNPYEGFAVLLNDTSAFISGSNEGDDPSDSATQIWQVNPNSNHYAVLKGSAESGFLTIQYMAKPGESIIRMRMSYTNTTGDNQNILMMRGMDPDVDSFAGGTSSTDNSLGATGISSNDLVNAIGPVSGKAISLYIPGNGYTHNVAIMPNWPEYNPEDILAGNDSFTDGDDAIEGAWNLGSVANGQTVSVDAYYILGTNVEQTITSLNTARADLTPQDLINAIQMNSSNRAELGSLLNRLDYIVDNLQTLSNNLLDATSRILDVDYASETANLTRSQILQQAATSMLAQANQMPNVVLTLLK